MGLVPLCGTSALRCHVMMNSDILTPSIAICVMSGDEQHLAATVQETADPAALPETPPWAKRDGPSGVVGTLQRRKHGPPGNLGALVCRRGLLMAGEGKAGTEQSRPWPGPGPARCRVLGERVRKRRMHVVPNVAVITQRRVERLTRTSKPAPCSVFRTRQVPDVAFTVTDQQHLCRGAGSGQFHGLVIPFEPAPTLLVVRLCPYSDPTLDTKSSSRWNSPRDEPLSVKATPAWAALPRTPEPPPP